MGTSASENRKKRKRKSKLSYDAADLCDQNLVRKSTRRNHWEKMDYVP